MDHTLAIGRIVHYSFTNEHRQRVVRPAIIVRVWNSGPHGGTVQLQVFTDGGNDGDRYRSGVLWATSQQHRDDVPNRDPEGSGTYWYWPDEEAVPA